MSTWGARWLVRNQSAAATRSSVFDVKSVLANSPSLMPSPVKSKRSTPKPTSVSALAIRDAAWMSLPQVKQWANSANAFGGPAGRSSRAANSAP